MLDGLRLYPEAQKARDAGGRNRGRDGIQRQTDEPADHNLAAATAGCNPPANGSVPDANLDAADAPDALI